MTSAADHWLYRLDAEAWLRAAAAELALGEALVELRRTAVTHARRAAGMALNGVLVAQSEVTGDREAAAVRWGRSYVDHLRAVARDGALDATKLPPTAARAAAALLAIAPTGGRDLVQLATSANGPATRALALARELFGACEAAAHALAGREAAP
ncbi:MAG: hypothetical protein R3A79_00175 [Nannocystaceae bacterium]